jgi:hypothetical protein
VFDRSDPRSALSLPGTPPPHGDGGYPSADYVNFHGIQPAVADASARTWFARGQHFIIGYTEAINVATFTRRDQPDEYMVLLPDRGTRTQVSAEGSVAEVDGPHLVIVPPGTSTITTLTSGRIVRIFTSKSADLHGLCANAASYSAPHRYVAQFTYWPEPRLGFRVRAYDLNVPQVASRFGRLYRCTGLMVNYLYPWLGPRDASRLSPHHHDDFQQGTLALGGHYLQHHRWAWTTNRSEWRDDEHTPLSSPALFVIPPPAIHTTEAVGQGINQLLDIFAPPRIDFSEQAGWVLNDDDYPMPPR